MWLAWYTITTYHGLVLVAEAKNKYLAYWFPLAATVALILAGAELTGPSMNPAIVRQLQCVHEPLLC